MSSSPVAPRRSSRNASSAKKPARSVSPSSRKAAAAATTAAASPKRRGRPPKAKPVIEEEEEEDRKPASTRTRRALAKKSSPIVVVQRSTSDDDDDDGEDEDGEEAEIDFDALEDELDHELEEKFALFLALEAEDTTVKRKVIRLQYVQAYALGFAMLFSSFDPKGASFFQSFFHGTSGLVQAFCGVLALAQAFSLTAIAQTSAGPMKMTLQYNMIFHLFLAAVSLIHAQEAQQQVSAQWIAIAALLNVGVNMWACYFHDNADHGRVVEVFEDDEDDESEGHDEEDHEESEE
ncbi:hypothetical protein BASA81_008467 [Batrachochytrium salamandrivorans]|nr:hypothetical protein BASA81_008467 [Batrachochytrium salamandrivorans]